VSPDSGPTLKVSPADTLDRTNSLCPESSEPRPEGPGLGEESAAVKTPLLGECFERRNGRPAANPPYGPVNSEDTEQVWVVVTEAMTKRTAFRGQAGPKWMRSQPALADETQPS
jgi:hypothetical protein